MIHKKLIPLFIAAFICLGICACNSNKQGPSGQVQQEGQTQPAAPGSDNGNVVTSPSGPASKPPCSTDTDCTGGQICVADIHQCVVLPPGECDSDQDCAVGETCDLNTHHCNPSNSASMDSDGIKDGNESDVDCGGSNPVKCTTGKSCNGNSDCNIADKCDNGSCVSKNPPQACQSGCTGQCINGQCVDPTPPTCKLTSPKDGATLWGTGLSGSSAIKVTFSEPMDKTTINDNTFTVEKSGGGPKVKAGIVLIGSDDVALFAQYKNLEANTQYTATITTGVKSKAGTPMAQDYKWNFTTANAVASVTPKRDADKLLPTLDKISVKFEASIDGNSFSKDSLVLDPPVEIKSIKQVGSKEIDFEPTKDLAEGTTYTAKLKKENVLAAQYLWNFSTQECPDPEINLSVFQRCLPGIDWQYDECGCDGGGTGGCEVGFSCGDIMVTGGQYTVKWDTKNVVSVTEDCHLINKNWNSPSDHSGSFQFPWDGPKPGGGDPQGFSYSVILHRFLETFFDPMQEALAAGGNATVSGDRHAGKFHCTVRAEGACGKEAKKTYNYSCP